MYKIVCACPFRFCAVKFFTSMISVTNERIMWSCKDCNK